MGQWQIDDAEDLVIENVAVVRTELVGGDVAVTVAEGPVRLEVKRIEGDPVEVRLDDGVLTIGYGQSEGAWPPFANVGRIVEDIGDIVSKVVSAISAGENPEHELRIAWKRRTGNEASVALVVPPGTELDLRAMSASNVIAGASAPITVKTVSGDLVLDGVSGPVSFKTMSGDLEAQGSSGALRVHSASGDVGLVRVACPEIAINTVSGDITLDCAHEASAEVELKTVSGNVALWLPGRGAVDVDAVTVSGDVDCGPDFEVDRASGRRRVCGRAGDGEVETRLRIKTVSGDVRVVRKAGVA